MSYHRLKIVIAASFIATGLILAALLGRRESRPPATTAPAVLCLAVQVGGLVPGREEQGIVFVGESELCGSGLALNPRLFGPSMVAWIEGIEKERDNLRQGCP